MPLSPLSRLAAVLLAGGCLAALPITFGARQKAAAQAPICEQDLPAATDGRFTLDRSTVQPGDDIVGVLTDFQQWPAGLIGGGSGETFLSCTPWASAESAEVIRNQGAPLVLLAVPVDAVPGTYTVSVVFQEGSTQPSPTDARTARLTASVTVATQAAPTSGGPSPACRLQRDRRARRSARRHGADSTWPTAGRHAHRGAGGSALDHERAGPPLVRRLLRRCGHAHRPCR